MQEASQHIYSIGPAVQAVTPRGAFVSDEPPAGATMRCKDGTYLTGTPSDARCAGFGGVAVLLPVPTPPPPAPRRP